MAYDIDLTPKVVDSKDLDNLEDRIKNIEDHGIEIKAKEDDSLLNIKDKLEKLEKEGISLEVKLKANDAQATDEVKKNISAITKLIQQLNVLAGFEEKQLNKNIDIHVNVGNLTKEIAEGLATLQRINPNIIIDSKDLESKFLSTLERVDSYSAQFSESIEDVGETVQYTTDKSMVQLQGLAKEMKVTANAAKLYLAAVQQAEDYASRDPSLIEKHPDKYVSTPETIEQITGDFEYTYEKAFNGVKKVYEDLIDEDKKLLETNTEDQEKIQKRIDNTKKHLQDLINTYEGAMSTLSKRLDPVDVVKTLAKPDKFSFENTVDEIKKVSKASSSADKAIDKTAKSTEAIGDGLNAGQSKADQFIVGLEQSFSKLDTKLSKFQIGYLNPLLGSMGKLEGLARQLGNSVKKIQSPFDETAVQTANQLQDIFNKLEQYGEEEKVIKLKIEVENKELFEEAANYAKDIKTAVSLINQYKEINRNKGTTRNSTAPLSEQTSGVAKKKKKKEDKSSDEPFVLEATNKAITAYEKLEPKTVKITLDIENFDDLQTAVGYIKEIDKRNQRVAEDAVTKVAPKIKSGVFKPSEKTTADSGGGQGGGNNSGKSVDPNISPQLQTIVTGLNSIFEKSKETVAKLESISKQIPSSEAIVSVANKLSEQVQTPSGTNEVTQKPLVNNGAGDNNDNTLRAIGENIKTSTNLMGQAVEEFDDFCRRFLHRFPVSQNESGLSTTNETLTDDDKITKKLTAIQKKIPSLEGISSVVNNVVTKLEEIRALLPTLHSSLNNTPIVNNPTSSSGSFKDGDDVYAITNEGDIVEIFRTLEEAYKWIAKADFSKRPPTDIRGGTMKDGGFESDYAHYEDLTEERLHEIISQFGDANSRAYEIFRNELSKFEPLLNSLTERIDNLQSYYDQTDKTNLQNIDLNSALTRDAIQNIEKYLTSSKHSNANNDSEVSTANTALSNDNGGESNEGIHVPSEIVSSVENISHKSDEIIKKLSVIQEKIPTAQSMASEITTALSQPKSTETESEPPIPTNESSNNEGADSDDTILAQINTSVGKVAQNGEDIVKKLTAIQKKIPTAESLKTATTDSTNDSSQQNNDGEENQSLLSTLIDPKLGAIQTSLASIDSKVVAGDSANDNANNQTPPLVSNEVKNIDSKVGEISNTVKEISGRVAEISNKTNANSQNAQNNVSAPSTAQAAANLANVSGLKAQADNRIQELQKVLGILSGGSFSNIFGSAQDIQSYINSLDTLNKEIASAGRILSRTDITTAQKTSAENIISNNSAILNGYINGDDSLGISTAQIANINTLLKSMQTINSRIGDTDSALQALKTLKGTLDSYNISVQPLEDAINNLEATKKSLTQMSSKISSSTLTETELSNLQTAIVNSEANYQSVIAESNKLLATDQNDSLRNVTKKFHDAEKEVDKYKHDINSLKKLLTSLKGKNISLNTFDMGDGRTAKDLQDFVTNYERFLNSNKNIADVSQMQNFAATFENNFQTPLKQYVNNLDNARTKLAEMNQQAQQTMQGHSFNKRLADFTTRVEKWKNANGRALGFTEYSDEYQRILTALTNGSTTTDEQLKRLQSDFALLTLRANQAGVAAKSFTTKLKEMYKKYGGWTLVTKTMNTAMRLLRSMVTQVKEVDTAMTNLKKVTEATGSQLNTFLESAGKRSVALGASLTDYIDAVSEFSRLGKSLDEAQKLGELATTYKTVAEDLDIKTASKSIISTMQAFNGVGVQADEIVDKFNYVGKMLPLITISVKGQRCLRPS